MQVVISDSFKKHMKEIIELKERLEADGIEVIKPNNICVNTDIDTKVLAVLK